MAQTPWKHGPRKYNLHSSSPASLNSTSIHLKHVTFIPETRSILTTTKKVFESIPLPHLHPTGLLIKLLAAGVCRSDHNLLTNETQPAWFKPHFTLGHEGCGRIVRLGSELTSTCGFSVGDVVAMLAVPGCGKVRKSKDEEGCDECTNGQPQLCLTGYRSGIGMDGFFAEYAVIDVRGAVHVPSKVTPSQAAVATDAVTTAYHAIHRRAQVTAADVVFLFGLGGLGFNALQVIRAIGAKVLVCDVKQENLDAAVEIGVAEAECVPVGKDVREWVAENGWEGKIGVVADFVGMQATFGAAQHIGLFSPLLKSALKSFGWRIRQAGRILCVGTLNHENTVHMKLAIRKRLDILFSYGGQTGDLKEALDLISQGILNPMVSDGKLEDFPKVMKGLEEGKVQGRVALLFD
ncbi:chaperonin 10-like protein [Paraphoma chrysanthemicola]|uniref:Chaperonin 10-like protein n=1 Tax=Paraphoma chrysanthemicola TaxID=798071 RepID=A0A8K0R4A6_9PLEO|nr:chaperonin 10-like protein [Paraphoma chrysanthemicola]